MSERLRAVAGWIAVAISTAITSMWAFWGILENFHEGWYSETLVANLAMLLGQYLMFMLVFLTASLVALYRPHLGAIVHTGIAALAMWYFGSGNHTATLFIATPLLCLAVLYWLGRPRPRRLALLLLAGLPLLTLIGFGVEPAWRVAHRRDDGDLGERVVAGNGVSLCWAPRGPGWPPASGGRLPWTEAVRRVRHLSADGKSLMDTPQDLWRLPSVEECVRSMSRDGKHCDGEWDARAQRASYRITPDKESPLWDVHSPVIYWWTGSELDAKRAWMIVYDGKVWPREKDHHWGSYWAFRAVRVKG